jgi:hypothetical protein
VPATTSRIGERSGNSEVLGAAPASEVLSAVARAFKRAQDSGQQEDRRTELKLDVMTVQRLTGQEVGDGLRLDG